MLFKNWWWYQLGSLRAKFLGVKRNKSDTILILKSGYVD